MQYLIADIETTGLSKDYDDILEFSFLVMDNKLTKVLDRGVLFFYHPEQRDSHPKAFEVHGITKEFLKPYEGDFNANMRKMCKLVAKSNFIGFNSESFDVKFIQSYLTRFGYGLVQINANIDIMKVYTPIFGRTSLTKLMGHLKITDDIVKTLLRHYFAGYYFKEMSHNAAYDVIETMIAAAEALKEGYFA